MKRVAAALILLLASIIVITLAASNLLSQHQAEADAYQFFEPKREASIRILWAEWKPADYLQTLADEFTAETGIRVEVAQRSWSEFQPHFASHMAEKSAYYDMVIGDSQWLGFGAENGHYINLSHWVRDHNVLQAFVPAAMSGYAEYPKGSHFYWAIPVEGDAMGFAYRKDLFNDPQEQRNFQQRYGYPLAVPQSWQQLYDLAEFFNRPAEELWGLMAWADPHYDGLTMAMQSVLWSWGADLGDRQSYKIRDYLNSGQATTALAFYKRLLQFNNPEWRDYYLDTHASSNKPLIDGQVAMAMTYFAIAPELLDPEKNPYADQIGFFPTPGGPGGRATSLGGQGISVISYSKKKEHSFRFLRWFIRKQTQARWSELGGLSCHIEIMHSPAFINASPLHAAFSESFGFVRDFWTVPEYAELLESSQRNWSQYLFSDRISARDSLDNLTREWEDIFEFHGYYKE
ncbi:ABC transporter substrate-binding protein [Neptuniibacter halophilus]|uniref:ABC transporter substrate-binding protein n=1 Tax=Neptuniibacter halophilus TaxID=651666 RepID=UPI002573FCBD|nr:extracellular solute-binding protein [Neptuniibacter halophilus]